MKEIERSAALNTAISNFRSTVNENETVERAIVFNEDGSVLFPERVGTEDEVEFTYKEFMQMNGKTLLHTHVDTGDLTDKILSTEDLHTAAYFRFKEIQAVTSDSISAFSPGETLSGNTAKRENFISEYTQIFEICKARLGDMNDEIAISKEIDNTAKIASRFLRDNERKYGYIYEERGVIK